MQVLQTSSRQHCKSATMSDDPQESTRWSRWRSFGHSRQWRTSGVQDLLHQYPGVLYHSTLRPCQPVLQVRVSVLQVSLLQEKHCIYPEDFFQLITTTIPKNTYPFRPSKEVTNVCHGISLLHQYRVS